MKKTPSKINVSEIISKHFSTMKSDNGNLLPKDKKYFFVIPIIFGLILTFIVRIPNEKLVNIFTLSLSVFIGLFLNLLVLIISFSENKLKIEDSKNRALLLKETFYNITYTIIISLIGLGILFLANIDFCLNSWKIDLTYLNNIFFNLDKISYNKIIHLLFYFIFYSTFAHIIITLLMIIKRIFKLFHIEIDEAEKKR